MAKYFFHLTEGEQRISQDQIGFEFGDINAAVRAAETVARDLFVKKILPNQEPDVRQFEITDAEGTVLSICRFDDLRPSDLRKS